MISSRNLAPLLLTLALGAAPLSAQPGAEEAQVEPPAQQTSGDSTPPSAEPESAAPDGGPAATTDESPFDYRSSEQISEDLSVSFPVDI